MIEDWIVAIGGAIAVAWEWLNSESSALAAVAALATVATAVIAILALRSAARDSRERSRPVVLASFRRAEHNDRAFDLVLANYGSSAAREIKVTFEPPFDAEQRADRMTEVVAERYDRRIPMMPPASEIRNLWWSTRPPSAGEDRPQNALKTPNEVTITITYKGNRIRRYRDTMKLDSRWMKLDSSSVSSTSMPGRTKQIAEALTKIAVEARKTRYLARDIAEGLAEPETETRPAGVEDLPSVVRDWAGNVPGLAVRLGITEAQASSLVEMLGEITGANPPTDDIDVIGGGGGQIGPTRGGTEL